LIVCVARDSEVEWTFSYQLPARAVSGDSTSVFFAAEDLDDTCDAATSCFALNLKMEVRVGGEHELFKIYISRY